MNKKSPRERACETDESLEDIKTFFKLYQYVINVNKRLIIEVDDVYTNKDSALMGQIADEFLNNSYPVFTYGLSSTWCGKYIAHCPVYRFKEEDTAIEIFSKKEIYDVVEYFEKETFILPYTAEKEKYMKYHHLHKELERIASDELDSTAKFYHLLKVVEYIWHYRALYALAVSGNPKSVFINQSLQSSMGLWNSLQDNVQITYVDDEQVRAYRLIRGLLTGVPCNMKRVRYQDICDILTQLRNRYVGHGTMAFSVSEELLEAIIILTYEILKVFYQEQSCILKEDMLVNGIAPYMKFSKDKESISQSLLSGYIKGDMEVYEYLDYQSGDVTSNVEVAYMLNYTGKGE